MALGFILGSVGLAIMVTKAGQVAGELVSNALSEVTCIFQHLAQENLAVADNRKALFSCIAS